MRIFDTARKIGYDVGMTEKPTYTPEQKAIAAYDNLRDKAVAEVAKAEAKKLQEEILQDDEIIKMMDPKETDDYVKSLITPLTKELILSASQFNAWRNVGDIKGTNGVVEMSSEGSKQRLQFLFNNLPTWAKIGHLQLLGKVETKFVIKNSRTYMNVTSRNLSGSIGYDIPVIVDQKKQ